MKSVVIIIFRWCLLGVIDEVKSYVLVGFFDVSLRAYGAVVYFCVDISSGGRVVRFLVAKTRVFLSI